MAQICAIVGVNVGFPHFEEIQIRGAEVGNAQSATFALALAGRAYRRRHPHLNPPVPALLRKDRRPVIAGAPADS